MAPSKPSNPETDPTADARRRRSTLILTVVAALTVLVPFLFWKQTWFGEPLTEEQITEYLADADKPRHRQQALVQIEERIERGDSSAQRWYSQMAGLKDSPVAELRVTLAWVLGSDNRSELFHETLLEMLRDKELLVRRNVALSLVRFNDPSGHHEILLILQPTVVFSPAAGTVQYRVKEGSLVERNDTIAQLTQAGDLTQDIRPPIPGRFLRRSVTDGAHVVAWQEIAVLAPAENHVWEALRALLLIGREEDLPLVKTFVHADDQDFPSRIREQAALTAREIRKRSSGE